jgi:hypothetical protein
VLIGFLESLTDYHKTVWKEVWSDLLFHYEADGERFLSWIVTGDGTWIHHMEIADEKTVTGIASSNFLEEEV